MRKKQIILIIIILVLILIGIKGINYYLSNSDAKTQAHKQIGSEQEVSSNQQPEENKIERYVHINSPADGDNLKNGNTYSIVWKSKNINKVSLNLIKDIENSKVLTIAEDLDASVGKYLWTIPSDNKDINTGGRFKIVVISSEISDSPVTESESFDINYLSNISDAKAVEIFKATEIINNLLPKSVEFWTEADCPYDDSANSYVIPDYYESKGCTLGEKGTHGGCPSCTMADISLLSWETFNNGYFEFKYPFSSRAEFSTYECDDESQVKESTDKGKIVSLNGNYYFFTAFGEAAAGTAWTDYTYTGTDNGRCFKISFSLTSYGCGGVGGGVGPDYDQCVKYYKDQESKTRERITSSFKIIR